MSKCVTLALALIVAACGSLDSLEEQPVPDDAAARPTADETCVVGMLTNEGVECPAMQSKDGAVYTLLGDLMGHGAGDEVCVCGAEVELSTCMQGTTLQVARIGSRALCP